MEILEQNDERMAELRKQYADEKEEAQKDIMRISSHAAALVAGKSTNALQAEVNSVLLSCQRAQLTLFESRTTSTIPRGPGLLVSWLGAPTHPPYSLGSLDAVTRTVLFVNTSTCPFKKWRAYLKIMLAQ